MRNNRPPLNLSVALALTLVMLMLSGCTTNPATGSQSFTAFMSGEDEARIGAEEHPKMLKEFGGRYEARALEAYVRHIGKKLAAVSEMPDIPWRFTVLNDPQVNAFALPGGYVYVTRGLLVLAQNEAELASVLAHEIGHVTARHTAQRYSTAMATNIGLTGLGILGGVFGVPTGVGRIISTGAQMAIQKYSQGQEMEADLLGVRYMSRASYDPNAVTSFLRKLRAHHNLEARQKGKEGVPHNIMSTHPRNEDRVKQAMDLARIKAVPRPIVNADVFLDRIDGMVFGDGSEQGVVRGRDFLHPELRVMFSVPKDFIIFNSRRKVIAFGPNKSRIIFDMVSRKQAKTVRNLAAYLKGVWASNLNVRNIERLEINGLRAATGYGRTSVSGQSREVRLIVIRESREHIYRLAFVTPPSEAQRLNVELRRATYSFRRLTQVEADAIKPLRLEVRKARAGDTVANLAQNFPIERFQREWFRLLNNMKVGQRINLGQRLKLVTE